MTVHRQLNRGMMRYATQGRYRFVLVVDLVSWLRDTYADAEVSSKMIEAVRELAKLRNDPATKRRRAAVG